MQTVNRETLTARLVNAQYILSDAEMRRAHEAIELLHNPHQSPEHDAAGRTRGESVHYWCGVVDTYKYLLEELMGQQHPRPPLFGEQSA